MVVRMTMGFEMIGRRCVAGDEDVWSRMQRPPTALRSVVFIVIALVLHALYLTIMIPSSSSDSVSYSLLSVRSALSRIRRASQLDMTNYRRKDDDVTMLPVHPRPQSLPPVVIFRGTDVPRVNDVSRALAAVLKPYRYVVVREADDGTGETPLTVVRNEYTRPDPRRLFVALASKGNRTAGRRSRVVRDAHPRRQAIIADVVDDGFKQILSFCKTIESSCGDVVSLVACLRSNETLSEIHSRYAGRDEEDDDTYIDLPISASHPALSTSVLRTLYANATLRIPPSTDTPELKRRGSLCDAKQWDDVPPQVRSVYQELYSELDEQIAVLRKRMLIIADFPFVSDEKRDAPVISLFEMLDAADAIERSKYDFSVPPKRSTELESTMENEDDAEVRRDDIRGKAWEVDDRGKLTLSPHT